MLLHFGTLAPSVSQALHSQVFGSFTGFSRLREDLEERGPDALHRHRSDLQGGLIGEVQARPRRQHHSGKTCHLSSAQVGR